MRTNIKAGPHPAFMLGIPAEPVQIPREKNRRNNSSHGNRKKAAKCSTNGHAMSSSPVIKVVDHLRKTVLVHEEDQLSDGQLLERYLERRDDAAFAALLRRHGAMVW